MTDLMTMARLHVTYQGEGGYLPDEVDYNLGRDEVFSMAVEAIRGGGIPGVSQDENVSVADFDSYTLDRMAAKDDQPFRLFARPKTSVGLAMPLTADVKVVV